MMMYQQSDYQRFSIRPNLVGIIFAIVEIMFLIFLVATFSKISEEQYLIGSIALEDFKRQLPDVSEASREALEDSLYEIALHNSQTSNNLSTTGAVIRQDSLIDVRLGSADESVRYLSFMVDMPDIEQSYRAYYGFIEPEDSDEYLNNVLGIGMLCPSSDEMIYADFGCTEPVGGINRNGIVAKYLNYVSFDGFTAYVEPGDEEMRHIKIVAKKYEYTEAEGEKYLQETKEFIKSLGISPDLFDYAVEALSHAEQPDEPVYVY